MEAKHTTELVAVLVRQEAEAIAQGDLNRFIDEVHRIIKGHHHTSTPGEMEDGSPCQHIVFSRDNSILKIPLRSPA